MYYLFKHIELSQHRTFKESSALRRNCNLLSKLENIMEVSFSVKCAWTTYSSAHSLPRTPHTHIYINSYAYIHTQTHIFSQSLFLKEKNIFPTHTHTHRIWFSHKSQFKEQGNDINYTASLVHFPVFVGQPRWSADKRGLSLFLAHHAFFSPWLRFSSQIIFCTTREVAGTVLWRVL